MERTRNHFIQSLDRGLRILLAFSPSRTKLTLTDLAQATGMNKPAVQRLTDTLMALDFLRRTRHKEFYLGPKLLNLGYICQQSYEFREVARESIRRFSDRTGHTVNLAVLDGTEVVVLYRRQVGTFYKFDVHAGSNLPSYCTALGKVLLAALPDEELQTRLSTMTLTSLTPKTITDADVLWQELMVTRQRGYSICDRESSVVLYSIGAPILDHRSLVLASFNISLFAETTDQASREDFTQQLLEEGRQLSAILGYVGPYPIIPVGVITDDDISKPNRGQRPDDTTRGRI
ncbi:MAG: IclR family transcriptional regulator [Thermodesulfobacteriota bacterium]